MNHQNIPNNNALQSYTLLPAFNVDIELLVCGPGAAQVLLQVNNIIMYKLRQWYPTLVSGGMVTQYVLYSPPASVQSRSLGCKLYSECEADILAGKAIYGSDRLTFIPTSSVVFPEYFNVVVNSSIINHTTTLPTPTTMV
jgi:hypothetical protein